MGNLNFAYLLRCALFGALYFVLGEVGLLIQSGFTGVTPFWPPSGFMLLVLLLAGLRYWPSVFIGIALLAVVQGVPAPVALIAAIGNTIEALVAWYLLQKTGFELAFNKVKHIAIFTVIAFIAPLLSSIFGGAAMLFGMDMDGSAFAFIWAMWWLGNAMGIILLVPLGLTWCNSLRRIMPKAITRLTEIPPGLTLHNFVLSRKSYIQFSIVILLLAITSFYSFSSPHLDISAQLAVFYLIMPLTILAAILWGLKGATLATSVVSGILLFVYHPNWDMFAINNEQLNLLLVVAYICITVITSLVVAALFTERQDAATSLRESHQQLKESELRLRQLSENIKEVFWLSDAINGEVIYVSPSYEEIWGNSIQSLLQDSENWVSAIHEEDRERVARHFRQFMGGGFFNEEYRIVREDGEIRWIHDKGFPVYNDEGDLYRLAGLAEDITERKVAEENNKRQQEELARLSRYISIGELGTSLAHEISQPLTSIICYSRGALNRLANEKLSDEEIETIFTCMSDEANRAGRIVKKLKAFVNRKETRLSTVNINEVVDETIKLIEAKTKDANIQLSLNLTPALPNIFADNILLQQVILNLSINAIEAMYHADIQVKVLNISTYIRGHCICLRVCDTGPGVADELLDDIMKPLFTTKQGGIGLGLPISYSIIEAMGGKLLGFPSQENYDGEKQKMQGFCFEISLPIQAQGLRQHVH